MGHIQAVLFDLYGTLINIQTDESDPYLYKTLAQFLEYYQINFSPEDLARRYQEMAAEKLAECSGPYGDIDVFYIFEEILYEGKGKLPDRALVIWVARLFRSLSRRYFELFQDALPALKQLKESYQLGIVSDGQWVYSEPEVRILNLNDFFDTIIFSSRYAVRKPDPQIFTHALKAMRIPAGEAIYVGDDPAIDLAGPQAIGMPVLLINRRYEHLDLAVPVLENLGQLPDFLETLEQHKEPSSLKPSTSVI